MRKYSFIRMVFLFFFLIFQGKGIAQQTNYDAATTSLGGFLNVFSERPSGFLSNPANLGLNAWYRFGIHIDAPYHFNQIIGNLFVPKIGHIGMALIQSNNEIPEQNFYTGLSRTFGRYGTWGMRLDYRKGGDTEGLLFSGGMTYRILEFDPANTPLKFGVGTQFSNISLSGPKDAGVIWGGGAVISINQNFLKLYPNMLIENKKGYWAFGAAFLPLEQVSLNMSISSRTKNRIRVGLSFRMDRAFADLVYIPDQKRLQASFTFLLGKSPEEKAQDYFNAGKKALEDRKLARAREDFRRAWCYIPENNFYRKSYKLVSRKIKSEQEHIDSWMQEAENLEQRGYYFIAAMRYLDILNQNPDYRAAKVRLRALRPLVGNDVNRTLKKGEEYLKKGRIDVAEKIFKKILLLDKHNQKARQALEKIAEDKRKAAEEYFYRGLGYYSQRNLIRAKQEFKKALEIYPHYQEVKIYLDEIHKKNRQKSVWADSLLNRAHALEAKNSYAGALDDYIRVLDWEADNPAAKEGVKRLNKFLKNRNSVYLKKSRAALRKKDFATAERYAKRVLRISPKNRSARRLRNQIAQARTIMFNEFVDQAEAFLQAQRLRDALANYRKALAVFPKNEKMIKIVENLKNKIELKKNYQKGVHAYRAEKYEEAIQLFNKVLKADPSNTDAARYLESSRTRINQQVKLLLQKGIEEYSKENYEAAIQTFTELLKLDPGDRVAKEYYNRSVIKQKAIQNLQKNEGNLPN